MPGKLATAGQNVQSRTPRHIIKLMLDMCAPTPKDVICDPACGTAGFLIAASEYLVEHYSDTIYKDAKARRRFNEHTFHGYDFDNTMLRIGSMNMLLHGVENPDIRYRDSLAQADDDDAERYSLVLANPPFAGSLDYESTAKYLPQIVQTKNTDLLFLALFLPLRPRGGTGWGIRTTGDGSRWATPTTTMRRDHTSSSPIRPSPAASTTSPPPRTCSRSSRPRRPSCSSSRSSCACSRRADAPPSSCPMACSSDRARRTRPCARS